MCIAQSVVKEKNVLRKDKITYGWWKKFVERQGDLSLRQGDNISNIRMDAVNESTMRHYFDLLETILKDNNLLQSLGQIYDVDETGVPLDPKAPNIIVQNGSKKVRYRSTGKKGQITVAACASASWQILPPTIIYDAKNVNHSWTIDGLPDASYGCSDKGWMTTELSNHGLWITF